MVALYRYREAERVAGPAVVGESVLLQEHEEALRSYPCTYRTLTVCSCWMVGGRVGRVWVCVCMFEGASLVHAMVGVRCLERLSA